jgi:hypothetical protein
MHLGQLAADDRGTVVAVRTAQFFQRGGEPPG